MCINVFGEPRSKVKVTSEVILHRKTIKSVLNLMERIGNPNSQFLNIHTYIKNLNFGTIVHKYQKYLTSLLQEFPLLISINTIVFFLSDNHDIVLYCLHLRQIVVIFYKNNKHNNI